MVDPAYVEAEAAFAHSVGLTEYEDQVVELPTLGCAVRVGEAGSGQPVLFVPGVNTTGMVFAELVAKMPNFRCIMVDRPGTGGSSLPTPPPTSHVAIETFADTWLPALMDTLGIDEAAVVSTSLGGWTAFRAAAAQPQRFTKLFGFGFQIGARLERAPLVLRTPAPKPWMLPSRVKISRGLLRRSLGWFGMKNVLANGRFGEPMLAWIQALFRYTDTYKNEVLYAPRLADISGPCEATRHDHALLAKVTTPVHLFWGAADVWAGERSAREFADALPNATLQMVPGAGHAPWLDEPELAIEALLTHLSQ